MKSQLIATLTIIGQTNCLDRKLHQGLISLARKVSENARISNEVRDVFSRYAAHSFDADVMFACRHIYVVLFLQQLSDTDHTVRRQCLELIGAVARPDSDSKTEKEAEKSPQEILDEYSRDTDPRVRTAAFKALVSWLFSRPFCCKSDQILCDMLTRNL